jgi:hypothetical protein
MNIKFYIKNDIEKCEEALKREDIKQINNLLTEFNVSYHIYYPDLHFVGPNGFGDDSISINELRGFKRRLEIISSLDDEELFTLMKHQKGIDIKNNIDNKIENSVSVNIDIMFEQVNKYINENGSLDEKARAEILDKVNELKEINNSDEIKVKKWDKMKPIFIWVTTKGFDIFLKIMPLIIQILSNPK